MNSKYKLVLFDLDGVIIDSKKNMEISWSSVQSTFEITIPFEKYFAHIGQPFSDIMFKMGLGNLGDKVKRVYDVASCCRMDLIRPYEGCVEVLRTIKKMGMRIGLVTSKDESRTLEIIEKLDLLFDVIECPDGKGRGKPNPDPLLRAILKCQMDPCETVFVGDMEVDKEAAKRAGIDYIHADWGYGSCSGETVRAAKPEDILSLILRKSVVVPSAR